MESVFGACYSLLLAKTHENPLASRPVPRAAVGARLLLSVTLRFLSILLPRTELKREEGFSQAGRLTWSFAQLSQGEKMSKRTKGINASARYYWPLVVAAIAIVMSCPLLSAKLSAGTTESGKLISHNTPTYVATSKNLGAEDPSKVIEVSIWLQLHNRSQFDALTRSLYDSTSPNYRHWLKASDLAAFAPTEQEVNTVRQFFTDHNLIVVETGSGNFYVRARGTVSDMEKAFRVQLNNYRFHDHTIRANAGDPYVEGPAGELVQAVSGLDTGGFEHPYVLRTNSLVGDTASAAAKPAVAGNAGSFLSQCFTGTETEKYSNNNDGSFPIGTYTGNKINLASETTAGCAYTPPVIQNAYHLTGLYQEHDQYEGTGQTIAIIDWCGTPTIQSDVNAFSKEFGLPQLIPYSKNQQPFLKITKTAPNTCESWDNVEINLDVEWSHAVAPNANINLVVPPSNSFEDVDEAEFLVVHDSLGTVLSGSYGAPESSVSTAELETENLIAEIGAAEGISTNYATGDYGDYTMQGFPATVNAPADSPWATAVGGVTLALNAKNAIAWQAGWGTNWGAPVLVGQVSDPPGTMGMEYGGGGGASDCVYQDSDSNCTGGWPKPSYQSQLPGNYRQLPDISWLADPTTGAAILISVPYLTPPQVWEVVGGTSLATPMFSGLWAIANQEAMTANKPPLGQAAPYLYSMPANAIYDIVPVNSTHNVTASIQDASGTTEYNASQVLGGPAEANYSFLTAQWVYPYEADTLVVYSFGTDCSIQAAFGPTQCNDPTALTTNVGWDNVTGVGVPNAKAFADYFHEK
jgi:subtilase family serine protease